VDGASWISGTTGTSSFEEIDDLREGLSTLIFLENCYYHAQCSNPKSAVFLLNFRTVPSLTFVHKFPISLCPFLTFFPFSNRKIGKFGKTGNITR
jgi:hypothetical protein